MRSFTLVLWALNTACIAAVPSSHPQPLDARQQRQAGAAKAFCSSADAKYKLSAFDPPVLGAGPPSPAGASKWQLSIDDTAAGRRQQVTGFGAAVTDATVAVIDALPGDQRARLLRELLTPDGADFGLLRHTIGASDLSAPPAYTYDDNGGREDRGLRGFALGDRGDAMAGVLAEMKKLKPQLTILGSAWAPPAWMQLDRKLMGGTENNNLDHAYVDQYAQYFVKYLQAYAAKGAPVDAITIQNEPLNSQSGMPTMYVYADEAGKLIRDNVGPALKKAGLTTSIWAYDHNTDQPSYPQTVLDTASAYVNTVAWHCYATNNTWTVLSDFHAKNPRAAQYMTECWTSSHDKTPWHQASSFTVGPLQNWAQGALAWTLATDAADGPSLGSGCETCRGLVVVNDDHTYTFTVDYYMLAQYSKYIPRGATVLAGTGSYTYNGGGGIQSVATCNPDGTRTVVIENTFGNDIYLTLNTKSKGEQWTGRIYANSVVTWVLP